MRGKRHIAQNACISLCGARRLQDKYITIFAFTLATRRSVSRQTYQTARSFRRTRLRRTVEDACPYKFVGRILWVALQVSFFRSHCGFRSGLRFVIGFMVCRSVCDLWYEAFRRMCVRWLSAYGSCDLRLTAARYRPVIFLRSDADTCRDRRPDCPPQTLIKNAIPPDTHIRRLTHEPYRRYSLPNPIFNPPHAVLSPHRHRKGPQAHPTGFSDHLSLSLRL